jgi:hypothetical protein
MSHTSSWLQKMRKAELVELADSVGFNDYDGMKKGEIEAALDDFLTENASKFQNDTRLAPFYRKRGDSSPVKKEPSMLDGLDTAVKSVRRRVTRAAEELVATDESEEPEVMNTRSRTALARTPRHSALALASSVPLPPSPAVVADVIDRRTQALRNTVARAYEDSGILETAQATRDTLSTVQAVQFLVIAFEAFNLRKEVLADKYAFTIPSFAYLNNTPYAVKLPDFWLLFTTSFWGPVSLWSITSLVLPLVASYFFNLTAKPSRSRGGVPHFTYNFDPLTFNIAKALLTYVIYGQDVTFGGLVDLEYVARINSAIFGGYQGVLVGTAIGGLVTLYDAVLKK